MAYDLAVPILRNKQYASPSVFTPDAILREARRQKALDTTAVPAVCALDPDGDIVRHLKRLARARREEAWACYHSELYCMVEGDVQLGIVPCAVGASYAVLIAEQLFASGCRLLISVTSAGQLVELRPPPYFVLIEKALRDEGTSYHYLPPSEFSHAGPQLLAALAGAFEGLDMRIERGATWTTDAPFRETEEAIVAMKARGLLAAEMEAAALYAFARARNEQSQAPPHAGMSVNWVRNAPEGTSPRRAKPPQDLPNRLAAILGPMSAPAFPPAWPSRLIPARRQ
jgi:uridine phosphorylase